MPLPIDSQITSHFDSRYYFKAITGAALFSCFTVYMLYHCLLGDFAHPAQAYGLTALLCGSDWIYYVFFSRSWKRITVTATEIIVYNVVFKEQITIPFTDVVHVGTSRTRGDGNFRGLAQSFFIEFNHDQSVGFNEAWYDNYDKLTMAIYFHKYGPGHGRERYLARHGQG